MSWQLLHWWWMSLSREDSVKAELEVCALKAPGRGQLWTNSAWTLPPANLPWLRNEPGKRNVQSVSTEIPLSHQGVLLPPSTAQVDSISTEKYRKTAWQAARRWVWNYWRMSLKKSSEDLLCLKKHLKWKIKGQTLVSLITLIWINSYWHSPAQQRDLRASSSSLRRVQEARVWTSPVLQRVRITAGANPLQVILTLLLPV